MADTLELTAGSNVTLNASGTSLTISATDTKYTIDSTLSATSTNPVQNKAVYAGLAGKQDKLTAGTGISISGNTISCTVTGGSGGTVTVDSSLSSTSTNPVQNKVIYAELAKKQNTLTAGTGISISGNTISCTVSGGSSVTVDSALSPTSTNPVQNKVIYAALAGKQNTLTIDASLSSTSANPVQNKAVNSALAGKQDKLTAGTGISISGNTISCTVSGGGSSVTVDSSMSSTSTNPVQNKVVYAALSGKQDKLTISAETWTFTLSSGSTVTKKVYVLG